MVIIMSIRSDVGRRGGIALAKGLAASSSPPFEPKTHAETVEELFGSQVDDPADTRERRRVERAVFETDRQLIEGDLTLPPAGYQSRFSDSLNRGDFEFLPLTNVEVTSLTDGKVIRTPFLVLSKRQIRIAYPAEE